jgi:hypothetical protein
MVAGTTCILWSGDVTNTKSPWICAWNPGSAIDSTDLNYQVAMHGPTSMRQITFNLTAASITSDTNPFFGSAATSATTSNPSSTPGASSGGGNTGSTANDNILTETATYEKAHGILMGVTVVLLFPIGAVFMRLVGSPALHALLQIFSLMALLVGFGLGIKLAKVSDLGIVSLPLMTTSYM